MDEHFVDCIIHHMQSQATVSDAVEAIEIAAKMTRSNKQ